jgi:hypothetical protein
LPAIPTGAAPSAPDRGRLKRVDRGPRYGATRTSWTVSIIVTDPSTLPAPGGRHPTPTRGTVETCTDPEGNGRESQAIPEKETVSGAEARPKSGAADEARTKARTTETAANKPTSESAATKAAAEATATKSTSAETATTETTSINCVGSYHRTDEREGS